VRVGGVPHFLDYRLSKRRPEPDNSNWDAWNAVPCALVLASRRHAVQTHGTQTDLAIPANSKPRQRVGP
jgi:hypothetical protein